MQCPSNECESTEFDVAATAYMSLSTGDTPQQATGDLDGISPEDVEITCKECGTEVETTTEFDIAALVAIVHVTKELKLPLPLLSSYTFEDGTVIDPVMVTA
ncbi:hypothetical protein ACWEDZ_02800 [Streptomyces sp. NPDC005047]